MRLRARDFRKNLTKEENRMWYYLRDRRLNGHKFVRELSIGFYIADFVCRAKKLIVEVDGSQHGDDVGLRYDQERTSNLEKMGYRVIRFWNNEVLEDIDAVLEAILARLEEKI